MGRVVDGLRAWSGNGFGESRRGERCYCWMALALCVAGLSACRSGGDRRAGAGTTASAQALTSAVSSGQSSIQGTPSALASPATSGSAGPPTLASGGTPSPAAREVWPSRQKLTGRGLIAPAGGALKGTPKTIVCEERQPCRVLEVQDAGQDEAGLHLQIVKLSLAAKSMDPSDPARITDGCEPIEYWLLARGKAGVQSAELLLELCNDGYGAAGIGSDDVTVGNNRFGHAQSGGSAWRWGETEVLQLSPRRILEQAQSGYWSASSNRWERSWSWERFSGNESHFSPRCQADGSIPNEPAEDDKPAAWLSLPVVETDAEFVREGWRRVHLGNCAARVVPDPAAPTADHSGFVIHGEHGGYADSHFSVVGLRDGSFVVEIYDDRFVTRAKRVLFEDHLEVWSGNAEPINFSRHCEAKRAEKPVQWGVRLADGGVFSGYGAPAKERLQVEVGEGTGSIRLKLRLTQPEPLISFVYSDSDDGERQKALIATSDLAFGRVTALGQTLEIDPKDATCVVRNGRLEPVLK